MHVGHPIPARCAAMQFWGSQVSGAVSSGAVIAPATARYPGWKMVAVGVVCMMIPFGIPISVLPLVYNEAIKEFGWTMTQATFAFSLKQWTAAAMALFVVAPFVEVRPARADDAVFPGHRPRHDRFPADPFAADLQSGRAVAGPGPEPSRSWACRSWCRAWFTRRQGLAVGIALAGSSLGGSLFPLTYTWLITAMGWRAGMAV